MGRGSVYEAALYDVIMVYIKERKEDKLSGLDQIHYDASVCLRL
jgi:hypothetical protein